jgi:hypothetical protein
MAAATEKREPVFDFPVISEGGPTKPKKDEVWTEKVWEEDPPVGSWKHTGQSIGEVKMKALGEESAPDFEARFRCKDYDDVDVEGKVPGGKDWQGKGKAKAKGPKPDKQVDIEFRNPKRWG